MKTRKPKETGRQAEKSAATRRAAIEGAIECFLTLGYARSSTIEISKVADVSRGAMIYHFPTKRDLLEATVEYIITERINAFTSEIRKVGLSESDRRAQKGIDIYWKHLHSRLFTAFHELMVAARTDPELAKVMRTATRRFETEWYRAIREVFPEWANKGALFDLAMDLTQFLLEGMALNRVSHDARKRRERIREYLKARLIEILNSGEEPSTSRAVQQFVKSSERVNA